ncbi:MAG: hypothetical protein KY410_05910 [Proteobacteria bacterium]|nr:hypothetical protein [Pseudomonadota bacterium]
MGNLLRAIGGVVVLATLLSLGGCATYGNALHDIDLAIQQGRPADALAKLETLESGARNQALYHINKGMLLRMNGDIAGSIAAFEAAKPLVGYQEAASFSETAGQFALAEGATSYQPRPFERLQLHVFQALNHLEIDDWDAARVEAVQINLLLDRAYGGVAPHGGDAFARYLSGIIFEGRGENDDALIAYRKALQAYDKNGTVRQFPADLEKRLLLLTERFGLHDEHKQFAERFGEKRAAQARALAESGDGELLVVGMTGLVPHRREVSSLHQDFTSGKFYRLSLPTLRPRSGSANRLVLVAGDQEIARSELVEDLSVAAQRALDDELPGLIARSIARNVIKNRVANEAGENSQGLEFLFNIASAVLENADTRSWNTLPERLHLVRVSLPEGTHELRAEFAGVGGASLAGKPLGTITIKRTRPVVVSARWTGY